MWLTGFIWFTSVAACHWTFPAAHTCQEKLTKSQSSSTPQWLQYKNTGIVKKAFYNAVLPVSCSKVRSTRYSCVFPCLTVKASLAALKVHEPYKRHLTTRFAKMILTPRSALKVHEPYISHENADSHFAKTSFVTEALVSQNGNTCLKKELLFLFTLYILSHGWAHCLFVK